MWKQLGQSPFKPEGSTGSSEAQGHDLYWWVDTLLVYRAWLTPHPSHPSPSVGSSPVRYPALPQAEELWKMRAGVCPKDRSVPPSVISAALNQQIAAAARGQNSVWAWWSCSSPLRCHSQGEGTAQRWRLRTNYYPKGLHLKVKF